MSEPKPMLAHKPNGWTLESYIAHNEAMWAAQRELQALRDTYEARLTAADEKALQLQAAKTERHLDDLNHENARVAAHADKSVSRELFDATVRPLERFMSLSTGSGHGVESNRNAIAWAVAVVATLLAIGSFIFQGQLRTPAPTPQIIYVPAAPGTLLPQPSQNTQP